MESFSLAPVPEIVFGHGRLAELPGRIAGLAGAGAGVMIVADPAMTASGVAARLMKLLADAGHAASFYDGFRGEPKYSDIDRAAGLARDARAKAVIGLGGGTALDTAKMVAACAVSGLDAQSYQFCEAALPADPLPLIAVPTTAGTGAEVTRTCIFTNKEGQKVWAWGSELKPVLALLDPELTVGVPAAVTAATGLDALVHAIEACTNRNRHHANDLYCHQAIRLISGALEQAVTVPGDLEARGALLLGSCYAGIGIDNCGTALAHNISHAMAELAPVPHGRATGLAMLATIDWVKDGNPGAFAKVAEAMGGQGNVAAAFDDLVRRSHIKVNFAGDGLDLARPELLAERMASAAHAPMRRNTMRDVSDADLLSLAKCVYGLA
ncbi:iron-containing alcohol dehydrogenase [Nordella sp. HKS 07]|uniref:iron-containing alcohol dehydrogenase n=1 Tax=Nordella sp. HKS 07 TaxID=2712222 RepID=UPI0013E11B9C|nr:iron-containing alcohol dehydrogenase [Nordella sp. HKS 07]QIG50062.1 iron-containing alcohol dehydrogenase [Nordella sp. HKS 07]